MINNLIKHDKNAKGAKINYILFEKDSLFSLYFHCTKSKSN